MSAEPPLEEVSPQDRLRRKAPRDPLSCHARRLGGPGALRRRPAARPPPRTGHPERNAHPDLLVSGALRAGVVPRQGGHRPAGRGFGLSQATSYRYLDEVIGVLAARAPGLRQALGHARAGGLPHVILDGKVVGTDRCHEKTTSAKGKTIDLWYSGKIHDFGGNVQALFAPGSLPPWVSDVRPGNVHDLTPAREPVLRVLRPYLKDMPCLADPRYQGAGHGVHTPGRHTHAHPVPPTNTP